jgi:glutathione S-transferase
MLELYHDWDSFYSFKARFCLAEKGLEWRGHRIDLLAFHNLRRDYLKLNPNGVVPTLVHDGTPIFESSVINEYLDEVFPDPPLKPADAKARARMRALVKYQDDVAYWAQRPAAFQLLIKQKLGGFSKAEIDAMVKGHPDPVRAEHFLTWATGPVDPTVVADARQKLVAVFDRLDGALQGPWLVGAQFTLADAAYASFIDRLEWLRFDDLWRDRPKLAGWVERLKSRPSFKKAQSPNEFRLPRPAAAG